MSNYFADQEQEPRPPKKSKGLKTVLLVLAACGGLLLLMCGGGIILSVVMFSKSFSDDPATTTETAQSITDIELPEGYDPAFSMNMFGVKAAGFGDQSGQAGRLFMLMSFPKGMADEAQMKLQMEQSLQQQGANHQLEEISSESRNYTIRGEECSVQMTKVKDDQGRELRQITAIFTGKNGSPAMLMWMMPEEEWTNGGEEQFEKVIASMK